jgi:hypothetical protein
MEAQVTPEQALAALQSLAGLLPGWAGPVAVAALQIAGRMVTAEGGEALADRIRGAHDDWAAEFRARFPQG